MKHKKNRLRGIKKIIKLIILISILIPVILLFLFAFTSRSLNNLQIWHTVKLTRDFKEKDYNENFSLEDYIKIENKIFEDLHNKIYTKTDNTLKNQFNRYNPQSVSCPLNYEQNWNKSFELIPPEIKGGVLLLHGLSDSPFSFKYLSNLFYKKGYYVLAMRMPGHGTTPSSLFKISWKDWLAASKIGAKHVAGKLKRNQPFVMCGYSNGAPIALHYSFEAQTSKLLREPDRIFLFSPAIGITKFSALSKWLQRLSFIPYFKKSKWQTITPEYDPFKYNSFPLDAALQSHKITTSLKNKIINLSKEDKLELPPITTFQSIIDSTVIEQDLISILYKNLQANNHELTLFDVNQKTLAANFLNDTNQDILKKLMQSGSLPYKLTVITNKNASTIETVAKQKKPFSPELKETELFLSWPKGVYSLSHISLLFPPDDPLYGTEPAKTTNDPNLNLGNIEIRGEPALLKIPVGRFMRLRCNPFFDYINQIIERTLTNDSEKNQL